MDPQKTRKKIRTLVVDDEPLARSNLTVLLRAHPDMDLIGECASGPEAVAEIRRLKPDLVFLDVQMPECDGFDVLELLGADIPPALVFVTAYDQYALRAFEAGALDYLLKPFDNDRFDRALTRAKQRLLQGTDHVQKMERLVIKSAGQIWFVKPADIDWIEAADYYACLHVRERNLLLRRSLAELEQELDPSCFCRIHRSAIVNLERIRGLKINPEGEYDVLLENGATLKLSRRYRRLLRERLAGRESNFTLGQSAKPGSREDNIRRRIS